MTRRRLVEGLGQKHTDWAGALDDVDFLARLYPVDVLPSRDPRFGTAAQDIAQHRLFNDDWPDDWVFHDARFGLADSDEKLLAFLAEMLHPAVRTDLAEVGHLFAFFNSVLVHDDYELVQVDAVSGAPVFAWRRLGSGVPGAMKNLIFAVVGPKPKIVLDDAVNNELRIVLNEQGCLVYDRPLPSQGLTWAQLTAWWADREALSGAPEQQISRSLYRRLDASVANDAERRILNSYAKRYVRFGPEIPALLPQVYLHYDPYTQDRYLPGGSPLQRQRMDFLMLLPGRARVVIECDGRQHYADDDGRADPHRYAEMMAGDRDLRLRGYEVYRFGGVELVDSAQTARRLDDFFDRLLRRYF